MHLGSQTLLRLKYYMKRWCAWSWRNNNKTTFFLSLAMKCFIHSFDFYLSFICYYYSKQSKRVFCVLFLIFIIAVSDIFNMSISSPASWLLVLIWSMFDIWGLRSALLHIMSPLSCLLSPHPSPSPVSTPLPSRQHTHHSQEPWSTLLHFTEHIINTINQTNTTQSTS